MNKQGFPIKRVRASAQFIVTTEETARHGAFVAQVPDATEIGGYRIATVPVIEVESKWRLE